MRLLLLLLWPAFLLLPCVSSLIFNVTVDDQLGDPTNGQHILLNPPEAWHVGQTCKGCSAQPSPASNAYKGTWSDASFNPNGTDTNNVPDQIIQASLSFIGTAVYVVCILTGSTNLPDGNTDMTFTIDNGTAENFRRAPNGNSTYQFNQIVFSKTGLSNGLHSILMETGHANKKALVLLDSIIYTVNNGSTTSTASTGDATASSSSNSSGSSPKVNTAVIIGPVVAAVIIVIGIFVALYFYRRKRQRTGMVRFSLDGSDFSVYGVERNGSQHSVSEMPSHSMASRSPSSTSYLGESAVPLSDTEYGQSRHYANLDTTISEFSYPPSRSEVDYDDAEIVPPPAYYIVNSTSTAPLVREKR